MLYQLSYAPTFGGDDRIRTCDILLAKQALYQLSYIPPGRRTLSLYYALVLFTIIFLIVNEYINCDNSSSEAETPMFLSLVLAAAVAAPSCWSIFDSALQTSAAGLHPKYVTYNESIAVDQDNFRYIQSSAYIDYRDDGVARVRDERFGFDPQLTRHAEPGPPELGPYGERRQQWIPHEETLPTIVSVRSSGDLKCTIAAREFYNGHDTYHLTFTGVNGRPSLKALWVDAGTSVIWKLVTSGYVNVADDRGATPDLAVFQVELGYEGPYLVVHHVVWDMYHKQYSQNVHFFGEYTMSNFTFPGLLPVAYFAGADSLQ